MKSPESHRDKSLGRKEKIENEVQITNKGNKNSKNFVRTHYWGSVERINASNHATGPNKSSKSGKHYPLGFKQKWNHIRLKTKFTKHRNLKQVKGHPKIEVHKDYFVHMKITGK